MAFDPPKVALSLLDDLYKRTVLLENAISILGMEMPVHKLHQPLQLLFMAKPGIE